LLDLPTLAQQHLKIFARQKLQADQGFYLHRDGRRAALSLAGNLRELRNVIERAVILATGDKIDVNDFPDNLRGAQPSGAIIGQPHQPGGTRAGTHPCASSRSPATWRKPRKF